MLSSLFLTVDAFIWLSRILRDTIPKDEEHPSKKQANNKQIAINLFFFGLLLFLLILVKEQIDWKFVNLINERLADFLTI